MKITKTVKGVENNPHGDFYDVTIEGRFCLRELQALKTGFKSFEIPVEGLLKLIEESEQTKQYDQ